MSKETARDRYIRETGDAPLYDDDRGATQFSYEYAKWLENLVEDNGVLDLVIICDHTYKDLPRSQWFKDTMRCTKCGDEKYH